MLDFLHQLNAEEKQHLLEAPMYVSILIAGADGEINKTERKRALELIHIKGYAEKFGVREVYHNLEQHAPEHLNRIIASLPEDTAERQAFISEELTRLNAILAKLDFSYSHRYYRSLRELAFYIASVDNGLWGVAGMSQAETDWVKLPMIDEPLEKE